MGYSLISQFLALRCDVAQISFKSHVVEPPLCLFFRWGAPQRFLGFTTHCYPVSTQSTP